MRAIIDTVHVKVKPVERVFTLIPPLIQGKIENGGNPESGGFYAAACAFRLAALELLRSDETLWPSPC